MSDFLKWLLGKVYQIITILFLGSIITLIFINRIFELNTISNSIYNIIYLVFGLYFGYSLCLIVSNLSKKYDLKERNN